MYIFPCALDFNFPDEFYFCLTFYCLSPYMCTYIYSTHSQHCSRYSYYVRIIGLISIIKFILFCRELISLSCNLQLQNKLLFFCFQARYFPWLALKMFTSWKLLKKASVTSVDSLLVMKYLLNKLYMFLWSSDFSALIHVMCQVCTSSTCTMTWWHLSQWILII